MKIHFVCMGNTFRSRLAEAYLNSLEIKNCTVSSSGIRAKSNENGDITWYAAQILEENKINSYGKKGWTQSTKEILEENDLLVFMHQSVKDECLLKINPIINSFEVWNIEDIDPSKFTMGEILEMGKERFEKIKKSVDDLSAKLTLQ